MLHRPMFLFKTENEKSVSDANDRFGEPIWKTINSFWELIPDAFGPCKSIPPWLKNH